MSEDAAIDVSAGALLRQAREASGLHVATLAANLKVPVRKLEALEEDRYETLGDAVFIRALASSVCRTLKVDPQPVLQRLPQTAQPRLVQDREGLNEPFRAPSDGPSPGWIDTVSKPVVLTVAALLLGALIIIFLPVAQKGYETVVQANTQADPVLPPGMSTTAPAEPRGPDSTGAASAAPAGATGAVETPASVAPGSPAAAGAVPTAVISPAPTAAAPATASALPAAAPVAAASAASAASAAAIPANGVVAFRTRGPSWIEVTDAGGSTVLRRLLGAGETVGVTGRLPLSVTVGDAAQTDVQVRGKPYNLAPVSRDNVARFEIK
jgi:cytoskeleton protein RodZ